MEGVLPLNLQLSRIEEIESPEYRRKSIVVTSGPFQLIDIWATSWQLVYTYLALFICAASFDGERQDLCKDYIRLNKYNINTRVLILTFKVVC